LVIAADVGRRRAGILVFFRAAPGSRDLTEPAGIVIDGGNF
jgi:hypothetical protein